MIDIRNQGDMPELLLFGIIGDEVRAIDVAAAVRNIDADAVRVRINSRGGSVIEGHAIYTSLTNSGLEVTTVVEGGAMSAGAVVSQAGSTREMYDNALLMFHEPYFDAGQTREDHRRALDMLDTALDGIVASLTSRTGMDEQRVRDMLAKETYLTASQAAAIGFIDNVLPSNGQAFDSDVLAAVPADILNGLGIRPDDSPTRKEPPVAEPQAATVQEIKNACRGASSDFVLAQVENQATLADVQSAWVAELERQNEEQRKDLENAAAEREKAEQARQDAEAKLADVQNAKKPGVDPLGGSGKSPEADGFADPKAEFDAEVRKLVDSGKSQAAAVAAVVRRNPDLHNAMLKSYNEANGRAKAVSNL